MKFLFLIKNKTQHLVYLILSISLLFLNGKALAGSDTRTNQVDQSIIGVTGTVTSTSDGTPLPGLSIVVKGTSIGTITNSEGNYTIDAPEEGTLVFSFVGFRTQEIAIQGRSTINVMMEESIEALSEVVVTALGIKREEKSLGFSVGRVPGEELSRIA